MGTNAEVVLACVTAASVGFVCAVLCLYVLAQVAVSTTLAASSACIVSLITARIYTRYFDMTLTINGILGGLVAITASCAFVDPWMAIFIGGGCYTMRWCPVRLCTVGWPFSCW